MATANSTYDLPDDVVEQLRCSHCNAYLSCGPIKVHSDGTTICGRCAALNNDDCVRQVLFETTMNKFTFPCRYKSKGCNARVLFNHAIEHELECPYRTFCCPALPHSSCAEYVSVFDISKHFSETHDDLILKGGMFKLEFEQDVQCNLLTVKDDAIVVVQYNYDSVKRILYLDCRNVSHEGKQAVYYKLQIVNGLHQDSIIYVKKRLCDRFESHALDMQSAAVLVMDNYLPVLENPSFIYINVLLTVSDENCSNIDREAYSNDNLPSQRLSAYKSSDDEYELKAKTAWNLLENFNCRDCHCPIIPPIYYYQWENSYMCYPCRVSSGNSYFVEKEVSVPNCPCRWRGCKFLGDESNIAQHVQDCEFQTFICPLSNMCEAGYFTPSTLMDHMQRHGSYCPDPENIIVDLFYTGTSDSITRVFFTVVENAVVAFVCVIRNKYEWELQYKHNAQNLSIEASLEHDHCRYKCKYNNQPLIAYNSNTGRILPSCFRSCKRISAVIKVRRQE